MEIIERISDICKKNGTTVANLEKELGYSNGSLAKAKNIPSGRILEISKYFVVCFYYMGDHLETNLGNQSGLY